MNLDPHKTHWRCYVFIFSQRSAAGSSPGCEKTVLEKTVFFTVIGFHRRLRQRGLRRKCWDRRHHCVSCGPPEKKITHHFCPTRALAICTDQGGRLFHQKSANRTVQEVSTNRNFAKRTFLEIPPRIQTLPKGRSGRCARVHELCPGPLTRPRKKYSHENLVFSDELIDYLMLASKIRRRHLR